jgi:hypothetical protein
VGREGFRERQLVVDERQDDRSQRLEASRSNEALALDDEGKRKNETNRGGYINVLDSGATAPGEISIASMTWTDVLSGVVVRSAWSRGHAGGRLFLKISATAKHERASRGSAGVRL